MRHLLIFLTLLNLPAAGEMLRPAGGVKVGKVAYVQGSSRPDPAIEAAIVANTDCSSGERIRYLYAPVKLRGSAQQWFVMLLSQQFVGSGGATALILDEKKHLVSRFTLVNNPVLVCAESTKGWKDLVFFVAGGGVKAHYARLRFNGTSYPGNPSSPEPLSAGTVLTGTAILSDDLTPGSGLEFVVP
ncbi:hypothetical protein JST97_19395 [bacterium]|nr:hypothetical protein [bacterium]